MYKRIFTGDDQEASPNREQVVGSINPMPPKAYNKRHVSRREAPFSYTLQQRAATNIFLPFSPLYTLPIL